MKINSYLNILQNKQNIPYILLKILILNVDKYNFVKLKQEYEEKGNNNIILI